MRLVACESNTGGVVFNFLTALSYFVVACITCINLFNYVKEKDKW